MSKGSLLPGTVRSKRQVDTMDDTYCAIHNILRPCEHCRDDANDRRNDD